MIYDVISNDCIFRFAVNLVHHIWDDDNAKYSSIEQASLSYIQLLTPPSVITGYQSGVTLNT